MIIQKKYTYIYFSFLLLTIPSYSPFHSWEKQNKLRTCIFVTSYTWNITNCVDQNAKFRTNLEKKLQNIPSKLHITFLSQTKVVMVHGKRRRKISCSRFSRTFYKVSRKAWERKNGHPGDAFPNHSPLRQMNNKFTPISILEHAISY